MQLVANEGGTTKFFALRPSRTGAFFVNIATSELFAPWWRLSFNVEPYVLNLEIIMIETLLQAYGVAQLPEEHSVLLLLANVYNKNETL